MLKQKSLLILVAAALLMVVVGAVVAMHVTAKNDRAAEAAKREQLQIKREAAKGEFTEGVNKFTDKLKLPTGPTTWGAPPSPSPAR